MDSPTEWFRGTIQLGYQKITLKSICFGMEGGLVVFLLKVLMDHPFRQSALRQVSYSF